MSTLTAEQKEARKYYLGCQVQVYGWCYDPYENLEELENAVKYAEDGPEAEAAQEDLAALEAEIAAWDGTPALASETVKIFFGSGPEAEPIDESEMAFSAPLGAELEPAAHAFLAELLSPLGLEVEELLPMVWNGQDFGKVVLTGPVSAIPPKKAKK